MTWPQNTLGPFLQVSLAIRLSFLNFAWPQSPWIHFYGARWHNSLFFRMARPTIPWFHFYGLCWPWLIGRSPCFQKWLGPKSPGSIFTGFFSHRPLFLKKPWPQCHWAHCYGLRWPSLVVLQSNLGAQAQNLLLYILSHFKTYREFQAAFPDFGHGVYCTRSCSQIGFPD